jgi:hypothetical protein
MPFVHNSLKRIVVAQMLSGTLLSDASFTSEDFDYFDYFGSFKSQFYVNMVDNEESLRRIFLFPCFELVLANGYLKSLKKGFPTFCLELVLLT